MKQTFSVATLLLSLVTIHGNTHYSFQTLNNDPIDIVHCGTNWETNHGPVDQALIAGTRSATIALSPLSEGKGAIPLPAHFDDMKVVFKSGYVQIDWSSFTEVNLRHYEIERSGDGRNFVSAGTVNGNANSVMREYFSWKDYTATNGVLFYRVKTVDADHKPLYSTIVRINISQSTTSGILIYPNPVTDRRLSMEAGYLKAGEYKVTVYDRTGRAVRRQILEHTGGIITQQVTLLSSSSPGLYTLTITNDSDIKMTKSFVVQ
jgi:hypothetical protein